MTERDGGLTEIQLAALSDHVAVCSDCTRLRSNLASALDAYKADLAAIPVPDADRSWRDLQTILNDSQSDSRKRSLVPGIWFAAPLAAAAVLGIAFIITRPTPSAPTPELARSTPVYDSSTIAGANFVEPGDPDASVMVYVDKDSGWLVVWATDSGAVTRG